ncbi:MAG: PcfJ domain-containing protein [Clostridia bacterium]|nr:PcfJ domain-containing protein [Clostridia bacterium]
MYIKKEIREFMSKMPKEMKKPKHWRKLVNKHDVEFNIILQNGREYECTNCGKNFYKEQIVKKKEYKELCPFCHNVYYVRRSNIKNCFFLYDLAFLNNIENKLVISYYEIKRKYNYKTKRFEDNIVEYARIVPELDVELASDRFTKFMCYENVYHTKKIEKWRVFNGAYGLSQYYKGVYLDNIKEVIKNTIYEYAPIVDAIIYIGKKNPDLLYLLDKAKYPSFELLMKMELYKLAINCPEKFNIKGSFEKRFGVDRKYYEFMKKHDITYEELCVLKSIQRPNIKIIRDLIRWSGNAKNRLEFISKYVNLIKLKEYSQSQDKFSLLLYDDYLENLEKLGKNFSKKDLFPDNFMQAHDESVKKVKVVEDRETREKIIKRYAELKKNEYDNKIFFIRPAKSLSDMKDEAKQQSNCIYTNYSGKYAKGETDIYFMRKVDNPKKSLVTLEVKEGKIRQKYQKLNRITTDEQDKFIKEWEKAVLKAA